MFFSQSKLPIALCVIAISGFAQSSAQSSPSAGTSDAKAPAVTAANEPDSTKLIAIKIKKADYPIQAEEKGIQGEVMVKMHISETGDVEYVDLVSGDPLLAVSAMKAAREWKFKPFIRNGKPIKVMTSMPFDFHFSEKVMNKGVAADGSATSDAKSVMERDSNATANIPPSASGSAPVQENKVKRVRVSQGVSQGFMIYQVAPVYPPEAKMNRVEGKVVLSAVIGKDGRIATLKAISGPKELIPSAIGAVQQWRYKPYMLLGQPVEVDTQITVNFELRR